MADELLPIMSSYANSSMTSDGYPEINSLTYMPFESEYGDPPTSARLVLVLVEPRLLAETGDVKLRAALISRLRRFKRDLRADGLHSRFIVANVYSGSIHKDGRIVLALRRFLHDVKARFPQFEGVILVGNFPEASLTRRVAWANDYRDAGSIRLVVWSEMISQRAEVVLADLTGNWEAKYVQDEFDVEELEAYPDAATEAAGWRDGEIIRTCDFTSMRFQIGRSPRFKDVFYLDDAIYLIVENRSTPTPFLHLRLSTTERNAEVAVEDRTLPNIIARPDIAVSRLNARHIAVNPDPSLHGSDGTTFLDAAGNPQRVPTPTPLFNDEEQVTRLFTYRDFDLERRLLIAYFDRNHRFRVGAFANLPFRGAVVSGTTDFPPEDYEPLVNAAASDFGPCLKTANATVPEYVRFQETPATLKYIIAHSNPWFSEFRDTYDAATLTAEVGGAPLRWIYRDGAHVPTFDGSGGIVDLSVHRAMSLYDRFRDAGASLVIHGGCNVNSVEETQSDTYVTANYARWSNAEGILFYTNCIALFSRAKGFNDSPEGFADGYRVSDRANFGSCWKSYINTEANRGELSINNIQRKRAYFWSINGDWSLRLRNQNGLGLLTLDGTIRSSDVHPNRSWIDGWNFDAQTTRLRGVGDIDGDGRDEMVVNSDWGIGIFKHSGTEFRSLLAAPRDTWFGGWRYDATTNAGRDAIKDVQNFTGSAKSEIMVWSSWGLATLEYNGLSLAPSRIYENGSFIGGWAVSTSDNAYQGSGNFDADGRRDIVLTSPWGLGILSLQNNTDLFMAPYGTRHGGWMSARRDQVRLIADLDGDGNDEILISSDWGIGVLKLVNGRLTSVAMHSNGTSLGGFTVHSSANYAVADNLRVGAARHIVASDGSGIHVLQLAGNTLTRISTATNGTNIGGWAVDTHANLLQRAGDINGDGRAEILIRSPWGIGVLGLSDADSLQCHTLTPHGSVLNEWHLEGSDAFVGVGSIARNGPRTELVVVKAAGPVLAQPR